MNGYLVAMFQPTTPPLDGSAATPARLNFLHRLESLATHVTTTQIYTHVLNQPGLSVRSPLDS